MDSVRVREFEIYDYILETNQLIYKYLLAKKIDKGDGKFKYFLKCLTSQYTKIQIDGPLYLQKFFKIYHATQTLNDLEPKNNSSKCVCVKMDIQK